MVTKDFQYRRACRLSDNLQDNITTVARMIEDDPQGSRLPKIMAAIEVAKIRVDQWIEVHEDYDGNNDALKP